MKRMAFFCMILILSIIMTGLCQTAVDPEDFAGQWYSSDDQSVYLFQEGLIYCPKHSTSYMNTDEISGAYFYCRDSIFLFADGIDGLDTEKELYLVQKGDVSFLCEDEDGFGNIYFIRYHD